MEKIGHTLDSRDVRRIGQITFDCHLDVLENRKLDWSKNVVSYAFLEQNGGIAREISHNRQKTWCVILPVDVRNRKRFPCIRRRSER